MRPTGASPHQKMVALQMGAATTNRMAACRADVASSMARYAAARRAAIRLRKTKWRLMSVAQQRFFKSSRECQALGRICCCDPTEGIRSLADASACRFADLHGDDLFNASVDGTALTAATQWFYGTLPGPETEPRLARTKRFTVEELMLLDEFGRLAGLFMSNVGKLPLVDQKRLQAEVSKWHGLFAKARRAVVMCSPACQGFVWLLDERRMPFPIAQHIFAFCGEY